MANTKKTFSLIMIIFGFFMVAVYLLMGIALMYNKFFLYISKEIRFILAFFFIAYGIFRLVRGIFKLKEYKEFYD